ncbi:MAG: hypothetical protein U5L09_14630 [Bacteroidales bacterium]|nr:hypothetical protein [Bacteroidales bacterium]
MISEMLFTYRFGQGVDAADKGGGEDNGHGDKRVTCIVGKTAGKPQQQ